MNSVHMTLHRVKLRRFGFTERLTIILMLRCSVEGIGSVKDELSVQERIQCGFCMSGWITNMYALNQSNELTGTTSTKREIDEHLGGNICRCTDYRPILHAFQSFANEFASSDLVAAAASLRGRRSISKYVPAVVTTSTTAVETSRTPRAPRKVLVPQRLAPARCHAH